MHQHKAFVQSASLVNIQNNTNSRSKGGAGAKTNDALRNVMLKRGLDQQSFEGEMRRVSHKLINTD